MFFLKKNSNLCSNWKPFKFVLLSEESAQVLSPLAQRSSGNAALDALIATAQKDDIVEVPAEAPAVQEPALPAVVDVQDIPLVQVVLSNH